MKIHCPLWWLVGTFVLGCGIYDSYAASSLQTTTNERAKPMRTFRSGSTKSFTKAESVISDVLNTSKQRMNISPFGIIPKSISQKNKTSNSNNGGNSGGVTCNNCGNSGADGHDGVDGRDGYQVKMGAHDDAIWWWWVDENNEPQNAEQHLMTIKPELRCSGTTLEYSYDTRSWNPVGGDTNCNPSNGTTYTPSVTDGVLTWTGGNTTIPGTNLQARFRCQDSKLEYTYKSDDSGWTAVDGDNNCNPTPVAGGSGQDGKTPVLGCINGVLNYRYEGETSWVPVEGGDTNCNPSDGTDGRDGNDGTTWTPTIDDSGVLSWTENDGTPISGTNLRARFKCDGHTLKYTYESGDDGWQAVSGAYDCNPTPVAGGGGQNGKTPVLGCIEGVLKYHYEGEEDWVYVEGGDTNCNPSNGTNGQDGTTWTPTIDNNGVLSWTENDGTPISGTNLRARFKCENHILKYTYETGDNANWTVIDGNTNCNPNNGETPTFACNNGVLQYYFASDVNGDQVTWHDVGGVTNCNPTNGRDGRDGNDGTTWTPTIDNSGVLSWTDTGGTPGTVDLTPTFRCNKDNQMWYTYDSSALSNTNPCNNCDVGHEGWNLIDGAQCGSTCDCQSEISSVQDSIKAFDAGIECDKDGNLTYMVGGDSKIVPGIKCCTDCAVEPTIECKEVDGVEMLHVNGTNTGVPCKTKTECKGDPETLWVNGNNTGVLCETKTECKGKPQTLWVNGVDTHVLCDTEIGCENGFIVLNGDQTNLPCGQSGCIDKEVWQNGINTHVFCGTPEIICNEKGFIEVNGVQTEQKCGDATVICDETTHLIYINNQQTDIECGDATVICDETTNWYVYVNGDNTGILCGTYSCSQKDKEYCCYFGNQSLGCNYNNLTSCQANCHA